MSDEKYDVSVIIPVYNAAETISACLKSVLNQMCSGMEILCIDSDSTDGTTSILEEFAGYNHRVRVIHSDRKSYGYQMNLGIRSSSGRYMAIVEADDEIEPDMISTLLTVIESTDCDFVKSDYYEMRKDHKVNRQKKTVTILKQPELYGKIIDPQIYTDCIHPDAIATWSGLYKKSFLEANGIDYQETPGAAFQDIGFFAQTFFYAQKVCFVNEPLYRYRVDNPGSSTYQDNKFYCLCDELNYIVKKISHAGLDNKSDILNRIAWIFYRKYKRNLERVPDAELERFYKRFSDDFKLWERDLGLGFENFYEEEEAELKQIIKSADDYRERITVAAKDFIRDLKRCDTVAIYGAGLIGKRLAGNLKENLLCLVTTKRIPAEPVEWNGIPIRSIHEISNKGEITLVIASKRSDYREQMRQMAVDMGFSDIRLTPYGAFEK